MAFTKVVGAGIHTLSNITSHNIHSSGIVTATGLDISGDATIGGVLTYEDVTSIDSVGLITARNGIDCNADLDVDGHTNLDNVSIAGFTTMGGNLRLESTYPRIYLKDTNHNPDFSIINNNGKLGFYDDTNATYRLQILGTGETKVYHNLIVDKDIDVDGHAHLDNVNISGVVTATTYKGNGNGMIGVHTVATDPTVSGQGSMCIGNEGTYRFIQSHGSQELRINPVGNDVKLPSGRTYIGSNYAANITNNANNRVITGGSNGVINGEQNLIFSGSSLELSADSPQFKITESDTTTSSRLVMSGGKLYIQVAQSGQGSSTSSGIMYLAGYNNTTASEIHLKSNNTYNPGNLQVTGDLDVDRHTNLDNVVVSDSVSVNCGSSELR